jgi:hypothetical protein
MTHNSSVWFHLGQLNCDVITDSCIIAESPLISYILLQIQQPWTSK